MTIPCFEFRSGVVYQGDARSVLKEMAPESVHLCCTSPPYLGLRSYGTPPQVWDDPGNCPGHEWGDIDARKIVGGHSGGIESSGLNNSSKRAEGTGSNTISTGQFCIHCSAWLGNLGLESRPEDFVRHLVEVFREVHRVLHPSGVCWLNLGDSYASDTKGSGGPSDKQLSNAGSRYLPIKLNHGLKPKDLMGIPWRCALALQKDGWWLRSGLPWVKRNPMPESSTDRPSSALEYVFMLTKSAHYFFDMKSVKVKKSISTVSDLRNNSNGHRRERSYPGAPSSGGTNLGGPEGGRNFRDTDLYHQSIKPPHGMIFCGDEPVGLDVNPKGLKAAHFASFPPKLLEPLVLSGSSARGCCPDCLEPWTRIIEKKYPEMRTVKSRIPDGQSAQGILGKNRFDEPIQSKTIGWRPGCSHYDHLYIQFPKPKRARKRYQREASGSWWQRARNRPGLPEWETVPSTVLDPFGGAMTTAIVAQKYGRRFVMIELSENYIKAIGISRIKAGERGRELVVNRKEKDTRQQSLFGES